MTVRAVPVAAAFAVLCAALLLVAPEGAWLVRAPLAVLLVAGLPGYTALAALRPAADLGPAERGALAVALSLVITIAISLAAAAVGIPLDATLWTLGGAGATLLGAALGAVSGRAHPTSRPLRLEFSAVRPATILFTVVTVAMLAGAAAIGTRPQPLPHDVSGTVALWILPAGPDRATLGVQNEQRTARAYVVRVAARSRRVVALRTPVLPPGGRWQATVAVPRGGRPVRAMLADASDPSRVLRRVRLTPGASLPIDRGTAAR